MVFVPPPKDEEEALANANDTLHGLCAGVCSRDMKTSFHMGRGIQSGRVQTNCHHAHSTIHAAFSGDRLSDISSARTTR